MTGRLRVLRRMLALAVSADRRGAVTVMVLVVLMTGVTAVTGFSQRWLVDSAGLGLFAGVMAAVALGTVAHGMAAAGNRLQHNIRSDLSLRVDLRLNQEILATTAAIPTIDHLERPDFLDRLTLLRKNTVALAASCWSVVETVAAGVSLALSLWLLGTVHPLLALAALLAAPPLYVADRGRRLIQRATEETAELERVEAELHDLCIQPEPAKEVRIAGSGERVSAHADALWAQALRRRGRAQVQAAAWQLAGWASYAAGFVAALVVVTGLVRDDRASIGDIVLVITLASQLRGQIAATVFGVGRLAEAGHAIGHYQWLVSYAASRRATGAEAPPARLRRGITLRGIDFAYPGTDREVLRGVDLHLPAGRTVALVGINGAGKTTLVKLLTGLHDPTAGTIDVDGTPLDRLDPVRWRERVSGTFQDFAKFQFLAGETVGVGDLPRIDDREAVHSAVASAGATGVVARLPCGLDTQLGQLFEGAELSHGQWQRLALARGHMRPAPLLLVLDEPTAALDPQAEHDLFERFVAQSRAATSQHGTVTVLVSHRFSTVRMADLIVVLDGGRVTEVGTHDELVAAGDAYAEHYQAQARGYLD